MPLTHSQEETIIQVDKMVKSMMDSGKDQETICATILIEGYDYMPKIMEIIQSNDDEEMDKYAEMYTGFYIYMRLLEQLSEGIQDGVISIPE